ncbi:MAG: VacJ family lipoprotein [Holosporales bacterium]|nr:VacJ family lipoprotein [Holosporales bacterium]
MWLFITLLSGCTSSTSKTPNFCASEDNDPYERANRSIFRFNVMLDDRVLDPLASFYGKVVPSVVKTGINNEIANLKQPLSFINYTIAGDTPSAAQSMTRFFTNLFFGFLGLFDAYKELSPTPAPTELGFNGALAKRKIKSGPYIMLPIFGPSSPRGIVGLGFDTFADPIYFIPKPKQRIYYGLARYALDQIGSREKVLQAYRQTKAEALDLYALVRSIYWQNQRKLEGASASGGAVADEGPAPYDEEDDD